MKRYIITLLIAELLFSSLFAKEITITADNAVELALQNHIDIQTAQISLEQNRRSYAHSWNNVLPDVSATGTASETRTYSSSDTDKAGLKAGVSASLSLDFGLADKIKQLKAEYNSGKISYDNTVRSTQTAVLQSFYNLLYLKEKVEAAKSTCESYQRQYDQILAKAKRGVSNELDLLTAQVNLETSKPDADSAENTYLNELVSFLNTIGLSVEPDTTVILDGSLDYADKLGEINKTQIIETCESTSSEVLQLEEKIKAAKYSKKSTASQLYLPSVNVAASAYPYNWQNEKITDNTSNTPNWTVSLGLSLPLSSWIPGSSSKDSIAKIDDTIKTYELQLENTKKSVRTKVIEKLKNIELSQKTLEARKMNVELAEKSYQMTEDAYNRGTKDLLTLQNSLDTLQNAKLQLSAEQYTLISNVLDLENTLSLPSGSLFNN
jgi:outer membrane protein TolC